MIKNWMPSPGEWYCSNNDTLFFINRVNMTQSKTRMAYVRAEGCHTDPKTGTRIDATWDEFGEAICQLGGIIYVAGNGEYDINEQKSFGRRNYLVTAIRSLTGNVVASGRVPLDQLPEWTLGDLYKYKDPVCECGSEKVGSDRHSSWCGKASKL